MSRKYEEEEPELDFTFLNYAIERETHRSIEREEGVRKQRTESMHKTIREQSQTPRSTRPVRSRQTRQQTSMRRTVRRRNRRKVIRRRILVGVVTVMLSALILLGRGLFATMGDEVKAIGGLAEYTIRNKGEKPQWTESYLSISEYARPGEALGKVTNIFVHYTANPGTNAEQNRSYFEQLKDTKERAASAHFMIGYEGEILLLVPLDEIAYGVKTRNYDSISVECCYLEEDGKFTEATYESLMQLLAWLVTEYKLEPEDILRHYDCGGKKCPLYYVEHENAWEQLLEDVKERLKQ